MGPQGSGLRMGQQRTGPRMGLQSCLLKIEYEVDRAQVIMRPLSLVTPGKFWGHETMRPLWLLYVRVRVGSGSVYIV